MLFRDFHHSLPRFLWFFMNFDHFSSSYVRDITLRDISCSTSHFSWIFIIFVQLYFSRFSWFSKTPWKDKERKKNSKSSTSTVRAALQYNSSFPGLPRGGPRRADRETIQPTSNQPTDRTRTSQPQATETNGNNVQRKLAISTKRWNPYVLNVYSADVDETCSHSNR